MITRGVCGGVDCHDALTRRKNVKAAQVKRHVGGLLSEVNHRQRCSAAVSGGLSRLNPEATAPKRHHGPRRPSSVINVQETRQFRDNLGLLRQLGFIPEREALAEMIGQQKYGSGTPRWNDLIRPACDRHEFSYGVFGVGGDVEVRTETQRRRIDDRFLRDMSGICIATYTWARRAECLLVARAYYTVVRQVGSAAYYF